MKCCGKVSTPSRHGCVINVVGFESHTVSVPAIHFAAVAWPGFTGTLFTNKGSLDLAGRLSKCVVPDREVQHQLRTQTRRLHLDLSFSSDRKRQGKGVTILCSARSRDYPVPHSPMPPLSSSLPCPPPPFSFPIECPTHQGLRH